MKKLRAHIMAEVECWKTLNKHLVLLRVLTHIWSHDFANVINEFVQTAAAVQFYHHSILQENVKRISWTKRKKSNWFPSQRKLLHLNCTLTGLCSTQRNMNFCCTIFFFFHIQDNYVFVLALPCSFFAALVTFFLIRPNLNAHINKKTG